MNEVLATILRTKSVETPDGTARPLHSAISEVEGQFIQSVIRSVRPRISLEVGCAYGVSSLYICEALQEIGGEQHIIIDPHQLRPRPHWEGVGLENLKRAGYSSLVRFYGEPSHRCLPQLHKDELRIDFAFIDGGHTFDLVFVDFFYIDRILKVGGVVVFDDVNYPSIRKIVRYIVTNFPYSPLGPKVDAESMIKRVASAVASRSPWSRHLAPELVRTDGRLGISRANFIALRKDMQIVYGDGSNGTRRWDYHQPF
jgi:predicted O-methyltransferase YrrM